MMRKKKNPIPYKDFSFSDLLARKYQVPIDKTLYSDLSFCTGGQKFKIERGKRISSQRMSIKELRKILKKNHATS